MYNVVMDPESLYVQLGRLFETIPDLEGRFGRRRLNYSNSI